MENDARAYAGFLMGNVISGFFVRRVYDTFTYIRRANYNEPQQTAKGNIRECNERIGERP